MKLSASAGLTAAETKECADKLLKTTKSTGTPATGLLQCQRDGFTSLCSPADPYKEEAYWLEKTGFKIDLESIDLESILGVRARRCTFTRVFLRMTFIQILWLVEVCSYVSSCLTFDS